MDFIVRPMSALPKITGAVVESNNWRLHEGYPAVDWLTVTNLSVKAAQQRATDWEFDEWMQFGGEAELFGPDLRAWEELFTQPLILGGGGSWVNGRHRAALIAASMAQYVALADPRWRPHWE